MSEKDITRLIALLERRLGVQWSEVVQWMRDRNSISALEEKLVSGRIEDVLQDVQQAAEKFAADLHHAYLTAGQHEAAYLDAKVADKLISFDAAAPEVIARARNEAIAHVSGLTQEARQTMRQVIVDGVTQGTAPRETARRLRDSLGLTPQMEQATENYRAALAQGDWSKALGYELSSGQGDRTIRRLQRDGGSLTTAQVDDLADRYRMNAIAHRAETIARTESLAAAHAGADDAMRQAIRDGKVDAADLVKEWHAGPATRYARKEHRAMDRKPPIAFDADFVLPDGTHMRHPGDPRGGPENTANCRCAASVTFREE